MHTQWAKYGVYARRLNALALGTTLGISACTGASPPQSTAEEASARIERALSPAGTWTALPANTVTGSTSMAAQVLTDGSLLVQSAGDWHTWSKYTPDASGNYANGTWSAAAPSHLGRLYFPFAVLQDGRFFIAGGEYLSGSESDHGAAEIYDPLTNTWTNLPDTPLGDIGDVPYQVLPDGRVIMGYRFGTQVEIYDPATNTWSAAPNKASGTGTEETWSLMPNGSVLNWAATTPQNYVPSLNQWVLAAVPPVTMQNPSDLETGPAVVLPSGKLLAMSAFGNSVLYTPGASVTDPGSWVLGPSVPPPSASNSNPNGSQYAEDVPACLETNGKVLLVSSDQIFGPGSFSEYDPATNTITSIAGPSIPTSQPSYLYKFVALPSGQVLLTGTGTSDYLYTPASGPLDSWRPVIQSVSANGDGSYTLTGTQLNGLSQGASYGDEGDARTNFPLVTLTSGTTVRFARTYAFSTMGFGAGSTPQNAHFTLPAGIPTGTYQLAVVTNGITSTPISFNVGQSQNQPPSVGLTSPANNSTFTAPAQIALAANASDPDGTISKVEFYQGATLLGSSTTAPYAFNWANVAAGSYSLTARAYDNANASTLSSAVAVVVSAPNQAPSTSITAPANNATFTAPAQITINANASDSDGTISKVEFYQGTTLLGTDTTSPYSFTWSNVASGGYALTTKAYDNLNAVTTSAAINVIVNTATNQPPATSITAPANNATFTAPAQITINANASDSDGSISKVEFYQGSTLLGTDTTSPYSFSWANVAAGSYALTTKAYDNLNLATTSSVVNVVVNAANIPPSVNITAPANNATFTAPAQITINANASDSDGTISKVEFYQGSTLLGTDTTSPYSFSWANVAAGSYALSAKAYDNLNAVTSSTTVNVVVNSSTGSNPCAGFCSNPLVFSGPNYQSGNVGTDAVCRETTAALHAGNCSNISARTLKVNGVTMNCSLWTLPAKHNGGYCVQITAGTPSWTSFATW